MKPYPKNRSCRKCKESFIKNSDELNYNLYKKFGFKTKQDFEKHTAKNNKCPSKLLNNNNNLSENNEVNNSESEVKWPPYTKPGDNDDFEDYKGIILHKEKIHNKKDSGGRVLWYNESKLAAINILNCLVDSNVQWVSLCAEPGSGKTAVIHRLIYNILTYTNLIFPKENITLTTGMSDTDWYEQTLDNFKLRDCDYLWDPLHHRNVNSCIVHRSTLFKRVNYLLNHKDELSNHLFIIDESHFADDVRMTFDKEINRLGLTEERMKEYKIKVIFL